MHNIVRICRFLSGVIVSAIHFSLIMLVLLMLLLGLTSVAPLCVQKVCMRCLDLFLGWTIPYFPFFQSREYFGNFFVGLLGILVSISALCFLFSFFALLVIGLIRQWRKNKKQSGYSADKRFRSRKMFE